MQVGNLVKPQRFANPRGEMEVLSQDGAAQRPRDEDPVAGSGARAAHWALGPASPRRVTETTSGPDQEFVSPPTMAVSKAAAISCRPRNSSSPRALPPGRGSPTATTAAVGRPAIAAMSLRLTAIALRPMARPPASRRKQLPSRSISVVTRQGPVPVPRTQAVSSPGPMRTRGSAGVRRRIHSMKSNSPAGSVMSPLRGRHFVPGLPGAAAKDCCRRGGHLRYNGGSCSSRRSSHGIPLVWTQRPRFHRPGKRICLPMWI